MVSAARSARIVGAIGGGCTLAAGGAGLVTRGSAAHMALWVAIAMLVGGAGLLATAFRGPGHPLRRATAAANALMSAAFLLVAVGLVLGWRVDADAAIPWGHLLAAATPSSTGLLGALAIAVAGAALALVAENAARSTAGALGIIPLLIGVTVCIGYLYPEPLLPVAGWRPITLLGGVGSLAWGAGVIACAGPEAWPLRVLAGRGVQATLLRWFLPFTVAVVVVTDIATVNLFTRFSPAVGSILNTLVSVAATALVTGYLARTIGGRLDRAEAAESRLNRLYAVVSRVNELIARERDAELLLRGVCRILVGDGGFTMAWAGRFDPDSGRIEPLATAGSPGRFLDNVLITSRAAPGGGGPAGAALRDGRPFVSTDIAADARLERWRERALGEGFASGAAFPLHTHLVATHVLSIYTRDLGWFTDAETALLENLAGDVSYALSALDEARQRLEAEGRLAASERQFRALIENSSDLVTITDGEGRIRYESPSLRPFLGFDPGERIGGQVDDLVHPDDLAAMQEAVRATLGPERRSSPLRCRLRHKSGAWRVTESVAWNMLDVPGVAGVVIHSRDVTDREALEARLRQAQKMEAVGQLAGGIAHDFNNILSVIIANAGLLDAARGGGGREELHDLLNAAERGTTMVRQLMGFARAERLSLVPLPLGELAERVTRMLRRMLPASVTVEAQVDPDAPPALADRGAVEQMVFNLATNARDAMEGRGTLTLRVDRVPDAPEMVAIAAIDSGRGMDEETARRVFEPFFTTKPVGAGTGLGLTMVQDLMSQHGGAVRVTSAPGRGTTIHLCFPVAPEAPKRAAPPRPASPVAYGGSETILVVEDEELLRRTARRALEIHGYRVITAVDGEDGLRVLTGDEGADVRLVFTDLMMPNLDGAGLYHRASAAGGQWRFLFASGYGRGENPSGAAVPSEVPYITKPWTLTELLRGVRTALDAAVDRRH